MTFGSYRIGSPSSIWLCPIDVIIPVTRISLDVIIPVIRISLYVRITCSGSYMLHVTIILIFITVAAIDGLATAIKRQKSNTGHAFAGLTWSCLQPWYHARYQRSIHIISATLDLFILCPLPRIYSWYIRCMLSIYAPIYACSTCLKPIKDLFMIRDMRPLMYPLSI